MSDSSSLVGTEGPKHGDRGSGSHASLQRFPGVIAVSRQPGSRGGRLANHLAKKCGYTLFEREALEFLSRDAGRLAEIVNELDPASEAWVEAQLNKASEGFGHFDEIGNLSRAILSLAAQGGVVFLGRGAGFLLPRETTLHVRVVADHADRERYLADPDFVSVPTAGLIAPGYLSGRSQLIAPDRTMASAPAGSRITRVSVKTSLIAAQTSSVSTVT